MMTSLYRRTLFWAPRVLSIAYIAFLSMFALDVFGEEHGFWRILLALTMHLIPTFVLIVALLLAIALMCHLPTLVFGTKVSLTMYSERAVLRGHPVLNLGIPFDSCVVDNVAAFALTVLRGCRRRSCPVN